MSLAIFDIDGTLTESVVVDELCFVQAFQDVLGIGSINTNWLEYQFQTDSGLTLEICRNHLGRDPGRAEIRRLQARFTQLLSAAVEKAGQPIREIPGAAVLLHSLEAHRKWHVAIATGGWKVSACLKLASAGLPVDAFPWANADDALDRVDILLTAIGRAGQHYGQDAFEKVFTSVTAFGTCERRRRWGLASSASLPKTRPGDCLRRVPGACCRTSWTRCEWASAWKR